MKDIPKILDILDQTYPEAKCSLDFKNPLELLVHLFTSSAFKHTGF